ncbi:MAG: hypothetical protein ABI438_05460, partial [Dermatophilaceae bacterium]
PAPQPAHTGGHQGTSKRPRGTGMRLGMRDRLSPYAAPELRRMRRRAFVVRVPGLRRTGAGPSPSTSRVGPHVGLAYPA